MKVSAFSSPLHYCSCDMCSNLYFSTVFEVEKYKFDENLIEYVVNFLCSMESKGCVNGVKNKPFLAEHMEISYDREEDTLYIDTTSSDYFLLPSHQPVE